VVAEVREKTSKGVCRKAAGPEKEGHRGGTNSEPNDEPGRKKNQTQTEASSIPLGPATRYPSRARRNLDVPTCRASKQKTSFFSEKATVMERLEGAGRGMLLGDGGDEALETKNNL